MAWTLSEIYEKAAVTSTEFQTLEEAFSAMCDRVATLTNCDVSTIKNDVEKEILWSTDSRAGWAVVCKTFAWLKGSHHYDWDIKVV